MEFSIQLNSPSRHVFPGSVVEGSVLLNASKDVDVGQVNITLRGRCTSWYKKDDDTRCTLECYFFQYVQILYTGNYTIGKANSPSWPFSFSFPDTAQPFPDNPRWIVEKHGQSRRGWNFCPGSPLPPSFSCTGYKMGCDVVYELDAKLKKPTTSFHLISQKFRHTVPLFFTPSRQDEHPLPLPLELNRQWDVRSFRLTPENRERRLTFKEKLSSVFSSDLPVSRFRFSASFPSQVVQGALLPIDFHTTWDGDGSTIDLIPPMHILAVKVTAIQDVTVRSSGHDRGNTEKIDLCYSKGLKIEINPSISGGSSSSKKSEAEDPVAPIPLGTMLNVTTQKLIPVFLSYGCRLVYTLTIRIKLQCVDQKYEMTSNAVKFTVASPYYQPGYAQLQPQPEEAKPLDEIQNQMAPSFDIGSQLRPTYSPPPYQISTAEPAPSYENEAGSSSKVKP